MKRISVCLAAAVAAVFGLNVGAQPPDDQNNDRPRAERRDGDQPNGDRPEGDREGRRGPRGEGRGPGGGGFGGGFGGGGFRMPPNPVVAALDADEDGELSEAEINNAVKALKALDKNNDGKLAGDEIRPQFGPPGGGGFGGDPAEFVNRMIERSDTNKDGKLSEDEMPEFMRQNFADIDTNKDGFADKAELEESGRRMRERFGQGRGPGGPGGPGGDRPRERPPTRDRNGDRPEGDKPPGDAPGVSADDL